MPTLGHRLLLHKHNIMGTFIITTTMTLIYNKENMLTIYLKNIVLIKIKN